MPIIEVNNISKKYNIAHLSQPYVALRDVLADAASHPFKFLKRKSKAALGLAKQEEFWALKDVNFIVEPGEVLGIIGRNGAGKSTLLKVLSQITPPTAGEIKLRGRIGSLLEVGTGFHPELSGRENIFLNGAILGMKKKEIEKKFDEIVAFAGIEKFLDTPVKHYSSGMYVRLAFSVAAHMEPDILLVDEVLAVGDAEFQKKCLGKMEEVTKKQGRTILFVSHSMAAISSLCSKILVLDKGRTVFLGETEEGIRYYSENISGKSGKAEILEGSILKSVKINNLKESYQEEDIGYILELVFEINPQEDDIGIDVFIRYQDFRFAYAGSPYYPKSISIKKNTKKIKCVIGPLNFFMGTYFIDVIIVKPMVKNLEEHSGIVKFSIDRHLSFSYHNIRPAAGNGIGLFSARQNWEILE